MDDLRIILLVVGVLFVAGIAGFEWWRSRGQRPSAAMASRGAARNDDRGAARNDDRGAARNDDRGAARNDDRATSRNDNGEDAAQEPRSMERIGEREDLKPLPEINVVREPRMAPQDSLPVIELASTSESGVRRNLGIAISEEVAVDVSHSDPYIGPGRDISEVRVVADLTPVTPPPITLAWPDESERRIVTLRVIPKSEPRFPGRALRQAFSSSGFMHGPLDIYHLPDEQGRALLSAAALAQPGTFDPSIMDSQRFSGLNLFAVLPGPLPEREAFEELVHAARQLADRLDGLITDQHGDELTAGRVARLRQSLEATPAAPASGQS
jgi:cell division protein ZipA